MSKRSPELLVDDIIESADKIIKYTKTISFEKFLFDEKTIDAVVRNFEIIGEAANRLPNEYRSNHKEIEWERIIGLRNRLIHNYFGIDHSILWNIIKNYLPDLTKGLKSLKKKSKRP